MATLDVRGVAVPDFLYGTAWKEDATEGYVLAALAAGFRGIDTANQRKHYVEAGVGEAIAAAGVPRDRLFLQTKFTYARGQDHRLPYDPAAPLPEQVAQSFASSLAHLGTDHLDSYLLHGPEHGQGWSAGDRAAFTAWLDATVLPAVERQIAKVRALHRVATLAATMEIPSGGGVDICPVSRADYRSGARADSGSGSRADHSADQQTRLG